MSRKRRRQPLFPEGTLCYLCQAAEATTEDHVPPQCFFPSGDAKGYTVPACRPCNQAFAKDDEYVRDIFVMAAQTDEARQLFEGPITRSFIRPYERLKPVGKLRKLLNSIEHRDLYSDGGIYLGTRPAAPLDMNRINRFLVRIVKGLHYHHHGVSIPDDYNIDPFYEPRETAEDREHLGKIYARPTRILGRFGSVFHYKGQVRSSDNATAFWWLAFYRTLGAVVSVLPPDIQERARQERLAMADPGSAL